MNLSLTEARMLSDPNTISAGAFSHFSWPSANTQVWSLSQDQAKLKEQSTKKMISVIISSPLTSMESQMEFRSLQNICCVFFVVAAKLTALASTPSDVVARARPHVEDVHNIFRNQFGISWLP